MTRTARLFLRQFARSPRTVGAIWPSSPALARAMLAPINFASARTIVEFGPGTGAFTAEIARRSAPGCRYLGIELNQSFVHDLKGRFPQLIFVHGDVTDLTRILTAQGIGEIDAILCGLPWASLPLSLQRRVFAEIDRTLAPGGVFVTFGYVQGMALPGAWALRRRLRESFAEVSRSRIVWINVPPAFAYICRKAGCSPGFRKEGVQT